jgi:EmrB/QacA subfamily drug resistance transporter
MALHARAAAAVHHDPSTRRWWATGVLIVAALMDMIDATVTNVALPTIGSDLHADDATLQWTVSACLLAFSASLIVAGHLGDRYGRRRVFMLGVTGFGVASLACGSATASVQLVAARTVQGVAAAMIIPQVLATFRVMFDGEERATAFGVYGAVAGIASAAGLLAGGALVDADVLELGWRPIFLVNIPIAAAVLIAAARLMPDSRARDGRRPDVVGGVLLASSLLAMTVPLIQGRGIGWPAWSWGCAVAGVAGVAVVALRGRRHASVAPLLPAAAFARTAFTVGVAAQLVFGIGMQGLFLTLAVWLQYGQGYTPLQAGSVTIAFSIGSFLTAPPAGVLAARRGRVVPVTGALLMAAGVEGVHAAASLAATPVGAWLLAPGLVVAGAGLGLLVVPLANAALSAAPADVAGAASGISSTAQQFGGAIGAAGIGSILFAHATAGLTAGFSAAAPWAAGAFVGCAALCIALPRSALTPDIDHRTAAVRTSTSDLACR